MMRLPLLVLLLATVAGVSAETHFLLAITCGSNIDDGGFNTMALSAIEERHISSGGAFTYSALMCVDASTIQNYLVTNDTLHVISIGYASLSDEVLEHFLGEPKVKFTTVDTLVSDDEGVQLSNTQAALFAEQEAGFMAGIVAGLTTQTKSVSGLIGPELPVLKRFHNGFLEGVKHVCPDCQAHTEYYGDFGNAGNSAMKSVEDMLSRTPVPDVVFTAAGFTGTMAMLELTSRGVKTIGVDSDQFLSAFQGWQVGSNDTIPTNPNATFLLTSAEKRVNRAVAYVVDNDLAGIFQNGKVITFGLQNDGIGLAPCHAACGVMAADILNRVTAIQNSVKAGLIQVNVQQDTGDRLFQLPNAGMSHVNRWLRLNTMHPEPQPRKGAAGDVLLHLFSEQHAYMYGGILEDNSVSDELWGYSVSSMQWFRHASLVVQVEANGVIASSPTFPGARHGATFGRVSHTSGESLLLFGGNDGTNALNDPWLFTPLSFFGSTWHHSWSRVNDVSAVSPPDRNYHSFATTSTGVSYMFGGVGVLVYNDLWKLAKLNATSLELEWERVNTVVSPVARQRSSLTATTINGREVLVLIGGKGAEGNTLNDVWMFDVEQATWEQIASFNAPTTAEHTAVVIHRGQGSAQTAIAVYGGVDASGTNTNQHMHLFTPEDGTWLTVNPTMEDENLCICDSTDATTNSTLVTDIPRASHVAYSTGSRGGMIVFGGRGSVNNVNRFLNHGQLFHFSPVSLPVCDGSQWQMQHGTCDPGTLTRDLWYTWTEPGSFCGYMNNETNQVTATSLPIIHVDEFPTCDHLPSEAASGALGVLLATAGALAGVVMMGVVYTKRRDSKMRMLQPALLMLVCIGCTLMNLSSGLIIGKPTDATCILRIWLFNMGFDMTIIAVVAKVYRVFAVFKQSSYAKTFALTDRVMIQRCLLMLSIEVGILVLWTVVETPMVQEEVVDVVLPFTKYKFPVGQTTVTNDVCKSSLDTFSSIAMFYKVLICVAGLYFTYQARMVPPGFVEHKSVVLTVYNMSILSAVMLLLGAVSVNFTWYVLSWCVVVFIGTLMVLVLMIAWPYLKGNATISGVIKAVHPNHIMTKKESATIRTERQKLGHEDERQKLGHEDERRNNRHDARPT